VSSSGVMLQVHRGAFEMMACKDCLEEDIVEVLRKTVIEERKHLCGSNHVDLRTVKFCILFPR